MRYAIYYTPPADDPLTRRAAHWLGRDAFSGRMTTQPAVAGFAPDRFSALTADPRRYGFHATMKAPFALADGASEAQLIGALDDFAARRSAFVLPSLVLGQIGRFFALVPASPSPELQALAADCVMAFDRFRAPLGEADIARRRPESLSPRERHNLMRWGYPYVLDDFLFHMTLTGPVEEADQPRMRAAIEAHFDGLLGKPLAVGALAIFTERAHGEPFILRHIAPLAGNVTRKTA